MSSKDELLFIPIIVGVVTLIGFLSFYAFAGGVEPDLTSFDKTDTSNDLKESAEIVSVDGNEVTVRGNIVGETGGQDVVAEKQDYNNGELVIDVQTQKQDGDVLTQVLTGYEYEMTVSNLEQGDVISINHQDGREFKLQTDSTGSTDEEDPVEEVNDDSEENDKDEEVSYDESDMTGPVTAEVRNYESEPAGQQNDNINIAPIVVDGGENWARVSGSMTGNTGGQTPVVESVDTSNGTVTVTFDLQSADGIATQAITSYEYSARVEGYGNYERIVVNQKGGQSDTLDLN